MTLRDRIQSDMKAAMKAGDKDRLRVVRMLLAAIRQVEVDERRELGDAEVTTVLTKMVKQRRDSVQQFTDGAREDLAAAEQAEIDVLETYLPEPLAEAELDALIEKAIADTGATGMRDMGKVMAIVKRAAEGRADMGAVSARVKARLG
ncbi:MAG: GatB/YqeY domain-containing protein [Woeseiaceae bacterium]|nr:GatB/YqeY domain-containing protein [Woeseiaceae bacterium]